jgi:hypothetical protein
MSATRKTKPDQDGPQEADFYPTPAWAVDVIVPYVLEELRRVGGFDIVDPGCGDGGILLRFLPHLRKRGWPPKSERVLGYEIRPDAVQALIQEAAKYKVSGVFLQDWLDIHQQDWLAEDFNPRETRISAHTMNAPYGGRLNLAQQFIAKSYERIANGSSIWALIRSNWLLDGEKTHGRQTWMRDVIGVPNVYALNKRPSFTGDGKADATSYVWAHWIKGFRRAQGTFQILDCHGTAVRTNTDTTTT